MPLAGLGTCHEQHGVDGVRRYFEVHSPVGQHPQWFLWDDGQVEER